MKGDQDRDKRGKTVSPPAKWLQDQTADGKRKTEERTRDDKGAGEGETRKEKADRQQRGKGE